MKRSHHLLVREVVERTSDAEDSPCVRRLEAVRVVIEWPDGMPGPLYGAHGGDWRVAEVIGDHGPGLEVLS